MAAQIAVGERAEAFQLTEEEPFGTGHERGHDAETGLLVQDPIETLICETPGLPAFVALLSFRHGRCRNSEGPSGLWSSHSGISAPTGARFRTAAPGPH